VTAVSIAELAAQVKDGSVTVEAAIAEIQAATGTDESTAGQALAFACGGEIVDGIEDEIIGTGVPGLG